MNTRFLIASAALAFAVTQAAAQVAPASEIARPGHVPGEGTSLPLSGSASNTDAGNSPSQIAPTLPPSDLGTDRSPRAYLKEARDDLAAARHTGQAQQALEMAETRALDRTVLADQISQPIQTPFVTTIHDARMALGHGDIADAIRLIDVALGL